jgi:L-lactate dehydrogenase (cytochrome)
VQCVEDCLRAAEIGVDAIYLSNHGQVVQVSADNNELICRSGRALDTAPPALYTLLEINKLCPEVLQKCEVGILPLSHDRTLWTAD